MKEICLFNYTSTAAEYGIGTFLKEYISLLKKLNYKINLIELGQETSVFDIKIEGTIRTFLFPKYGMEYMNWYHQSVFRFLDLYIENKDNLLFHFHYLHYDGLIENVKKHFPSSKIILTIHYLNWSQILTGDDRLFLKIGMQEEKNIKNKLHKNVISQFRKEKAFFEEIDAIISLCENTFDLLHNHYCVDKKKLYLISNGLEDASNVLTERRKMKIRKEYVINEEEKILLYVGRLDKIKGIHPFIKAFNIILNEYPNCRLVLIGNGDYNLIYNNSSKIWTKITLTGKLAKKELLKWYQIADIGIFPSYYEECSYVGIEMMMHGLPIVASDGYGVRNMFQNGINARIALIEDRKNSKLLITNLSKAVLELFSSEGLAENLGKQSRQIYENKYELSIMQEKYKQLLSKL
jgi:glycosyltransferase